MQIRESPEYANRESGTPVMSANASRRQIGSAPMNSVMITAFAAIGGSLVGALGSAVGTWITARHQDRRDLLGKQIARREALYSDFIGESARLLVDAMQHNSGDLQTMLPLYALAGRIRLSSSEPVLQEADRRHKDYCHHLSKQQPHSRRD
jgi:hypothetical protein